MTQNMREIPRYENGEKASCSCGCDAEIYVCPECDSTAAMLLEAKIAERDESIKRFNKRMACDDARLYRKNAPDFYVHSRIMLKTSRGFECVQCLSNAMDLLKQTLRDVEPITAKLDNE